MDASIEGLLRQLAPQALAALVRKHGCFDLAEDAVQEALLAAASQWESNPPRNPRGWLLRVAQRRLVDMIRVESSRRAREDLYHRQAAHDFDPAADRDDSLDLLFLCCHPDLTAPSAVALTLRAVGGLTTEEIGRAFLVPTSTIAQRISRAKATIAASGNDFRCTPGDRDTRVGRVLTVLYLVFNEGYSASAGDGLGRPDLTSEAIRLTRMLRDKLPDHAEVAGLLALQLLHHARRQARERDGEPVPLAEQDRTLWDHEAIAEGTRLVEQALPRGPLGRYQVMAAISALHDQAPDDEHTDWPQILALYDVAALLDPSPMVSVSRAVAVARVHGPRAGLKALDALTEDRRLRGSHRPLVVRAHLLAEAGETAAAVDAFARAARLTRSVPERRYLEGRIRGLATSGPGASARLRGPSSADG